MNMDFFQVIDSETLQPQGFTRSAIEMVLMIVIGCALCRYIQVGTSYLVKGMSGGSKIKRAPVSRGGFGAPPTGDLDDEGLSLKPKDVRSPVVAKEPSDAFVVPKTTAGTAVHHRNPQTKEGPASPTASISNPPPSITSTAAPTRDASIDSFNVKNTTSITTTVKKPLPETSEASHNHVHVHPTKPTATTTAATAMPDSLLDNTLDEIFDAEDMLDDALMAATDGTAKAEEAQVAEKKIASQPSSATNKVAATAAKPAASVTTLQNSATNKPAAALAANAKAEEEEDGMFAEMRRKKLAKQKAQQEASSVSSPPASPTQQKAAPAPPTSSVAANKSKPAAPTTHVPAQPAKPATAEHLLDNTLDEVFDDDALLEEALTDV